MTIRLAVLSDVHGNLMALEAVLADIKAQGAPDAIWVLGDLAAFCPWPSETLARLRALRNVAFLQGNTDRYLVTGQRPAFAVRSTKDWNAMPALLAGRDANFRWTIERISFADFEFLRDLPARLEMDVAGYGRVVAVHASAKDDETFLPPSVPDDKLLANFAGLDGRLALYGHTHRPLDRTVNSIRIINDGSVGLPMDGDPRPAYAVLDFENGQCNVALHRVAYDREPVIAKLEQVEHPAQVWVSGILKEARL